MRSKQFTRDIIDTLGNSNFSLRLVTSSPTDVVWANAYNKFDPTSPFGGYKESGSRLRQAFRVAYVGREGGVQGLAAYCQLD